MPRRKADNPVKNPDKLQPGVHIAIQPGDQVQTPYGVGKVESISLPVLVFEDSKKKPELNPPQVKVTIQETGQTVLACLCEIGLPNKQLETIIHDEYSRLWPPLEEETPMADDTALSVAFLKKARRKEEARVRTLVSHRILSLAEGRARLAAFKEVRTVGQYHQYKSGQLKVAVRLPNPKKIPPQQPISQAQFWEYIGKLDVEAKNVLKVVPPEYWKAFSSMFLKLREKFFNAASPQSYLGDDSLTDAASSAISLGRSSFTKLLRSLEKANATKDKAKQEELARYIYDNLASSHGETFQYPIIFLEDVVDGTMDQSEANSLYGGGR